MNRALSKEILYILERFTPEQRGRVTTAWLEHEAYGVIAEFDDLALDTAFRAIIGMSRCLASPQQADVAISPQPEPEPPEMEQSKPPEENAVERQRVKLRQLKQRAMDIAKVAPDDVARRLRMCSHRLIKTEGGYLSSIERCNGRICPLCREAKMSKHKSKLEQAFNVLREKTPAAKYLFATFTVKNVPLKQLNNAIDELHHAWAKMTKRAVLLKSMYGFTKTVHITKGDDGLAHPHLHIIFAMKSDYRKFMNKPLGTDWGTLWAQAVDKEYCPQVKVKSVMDDAYLQELISYITNNGIAENKDLTWVTACDNALSRNRRFISFGGTIKDILQDISNGNDSDWLDTCNPQSSLIWDINSEDYVDENIEKRE